MGALAVGEASTVLARATGFVTARTRFVTARAHGRAGATGASSGAAARTRSGCPDALPMDGLVHRALARPLLFQSAFGKDRVTRPASRFDVAPGRGREGISRGRARFTDLTGRSQMKKLHVRKGGFTLI